MAKFRQGHVVLQAGKSVSFGNINGYGLRDNNGVIQFKDSDGEWTNVGGGGIIPNHEVVSTGVEDLLAIDTTGNSVLFEVKHIRIPANVNNFVAGYEAAYGITSGQNNTCIGYQSLYYNQTGNQNVAVGSQAAKGTTGGEGYNPAYNVIIGYQAAYVIAAAYNNVIIGYQAAYNLTNSQRNVLIGSQTGYNLTTGLSNWNIFIGDSAGYGQTTAITNIAIGYRSLYYNQTGGYNTAIGYEAASGSTGGEGYNPIWNVAIGYQALRVIESAYRNIGIGYQSGYSLTTAQDNVLLGAYAGYYNLIGNQNTIVGNEAGYGSSGQNQNNAVLVGYRAGYSLTGASGVVVIGYQAGYNLTQGNASTLVGFEAGYSLISPRYNTLIGYRAGYYNAAGYGNTILGYLADQGVTGNSNEYNVFIGRQAAWQVDYRPSQCRITYQVGQGGTTTIYDYTFNSIGSIFIAVGGPGQAIIDLTFLSNDIDRIDMYGCDEITNIEFK